MMSSVAESRLDKSRGQFPQQINLLTATIRDLQDHLASGAITSVQLVEEYLVSHHEGEQAERQATNSQASETHRGKRSVGS